MKSILRSVTPKFLKRFIGVMRYRFPIIVANIRWGIQGPKDIDYKQIPIVINNFNRLWYLQKLVESLRKRGYNNLYVIDNNSTYPPLLDFYEKCDLTVFRLSENVGYKSIWQTDIYQHFKHSYYVYTDVDMQIDDDCPEDFMEHFVKILQKYPMAQKVGFGIRIDDLPDCYHNKKEVQEWESQFWKKEVEPGLYEAAIDTTFALYRPYCQGAACSYHQTFRTGRPYLIKHLPWYQDSQKPTEENLYYAQNIRTSTHWSQKDVIGK